MKKFLDNYKKNLAVIPSRIEKASKGKFISLLFVLFLLPEETILCLDEYFKNNQSINYKTSISEKRPHQIIFKIIFYQARSEAY
tara:strand:+ start:1783 stop:2034 length:252 start_codon:yes stop_codon:yes gene_type:complete